MKTIRKEAPPRYEIDGADSSSGSLVPGTMVGEFRVGELLGSGTFGDVYAGEQPLIGKRVAIKVLNRWFSAQPEMVSRFVAEARAVNRIRHRNIIDIFSFGTLHGDRFYFVMELLDGATLSRLLQDEGALDPERALPILRGVAEALDAAHRAGIAHRDLKPDNIFVAVDDGGSPFPKLLDFGMAKLLDEEATTHKTATGAPVGTPSYMSPEQCRGMKMDHRSDIYAFGVLTHRVLTGELPFQSQVLMDLMVQHTSHPAPTMSSVRPALPAALDAPVLSMLSKRPEERPPSMAAAFNALQAAMEEAGVVDPSASMTADRSSKRIGSRGPLPSRGVGDSAPRPFGSSPSLEVAMDPTVPVAKEGGALDGAIDPGAGANARSGPEMKAAGPESMDRTLSGMLAHPAGSPARSRSLKVAGAMGAAFGGALVAFALLQPGDPTVDPGVPERAASQGVPAPTVDVVPSRALSANRPELEPDGSAQVHVLPAPSGAELLPDAQRAGAAPPGAAARPSLPPLPSGAGRRPAGASSTGARASASAAPAARPRDVDTPDEFRSP